MNYGYIPDEPSEKDYVLGGFKLGAEILQEDGQWLDYLPTFEHQRKNFDTQGCVSFGTNSALEMLHKRKYGTEPNYSDRYIAKMSDTTPYGNSPRKVADTVRKVSGEVNETEWPFAGNNWDEYYQEIPDLIAEKGSNWYADYEFGYEYAYGKQQIMGALKLSPVGVAVAAWAQDENGLYYDFGQPNHWCVCVGYKENEYWLVFDSYEEKVKKLRWDFNFPVAIRYSLSKKKVKKSPLAELIILIQRWILNWATH